MATHQLKKVIVNLPMDLAIEVEKLAQQQKSTRSELIRLSLRAYLQKLKKADLREQLKQGYIANASRDQQIEEEFVHSDYELEQRLTRTEEQ